MCQSNVYFIKDGKEELVMKDVSLIRPGDGEVFLEGIMGEQRIVKGRIKELQLTEHKILLEK